MKKREATKEFVFVILNKSPELTARDIYEEMRHTKPGILRADRIRGIKSFVQIIKSFPELEVCGKKENRNIYKAHQNP